MEQEIINRVASSTLVSIDLEQYYPIQERVLLDIKDQLYEGLILREKDFREWIKTHDWTFYKNKFVAITCSEDAIIPTWAFMLLAIKLEPQAKMVISGSLETLEQIIWTKIIDSIDVNPFTGSKVVIKGCSKKPVPLSAFTALSGKLTPIVDSMMFGEPCSTVPLYKKPSPLKVPKPIHN